MTSEIQSEALQLAGKLGPKATGKKTKGGKKKRRKKKKKGKTKKGTNPYRTLFEDKGGRGAKSKPGGKKNSLTELEILL